MTKVTDKLAALRELSKKKLQITGPSAITGEARVQGSKNTANKLVAVTIALPGKYHIKNFPYILDPLELLGLVEYLGGTVDLGPDNTVTVDTTKIQNKEIPFEMTNSTTGAFGLAGALLGRFKEVNIGKPGGDKIGPRPVDLHVDCFRALGADIQEEAEVIHGTLSQKPHDKYFELKMPSTGAAVNYILAAAGSGGTAEIRNTPVDGDMDGMYGLLREAGVDVTQNGSEIVINATSFSQKDQPIMYDCPPDRNDAFTWLAYGALSEKGVTVSGLSLIDMAEALPVLKLLNVQITQKNDSTLLIQTPAIHTDPDPHIVVAGLAREFHSDWAPFLDVIAARVPSNIIIIDTLFSNRVRQAELLKEMGANVEIGGGQPPAGVKLHFDADPHKAKYIVRVKGPAELKPITTEIGYDVRACAAVVMAATQAKGVSKLSEVQALYRGYENIIERLRAIGVNISEVNPD